MLRSIACQRIFASLTRYFEHLQSHLAHSPPGVSIRCGLSRRSRRRRGRISETVSFFPPGGRMSYLSVDPCVSIYTAAHTSRRVASPASFSSFFWLRAEQDPLWTRQLAHLPTVTSGSSPTELFILYQLFADFEERLLLYDQPKSECFRSTIWLSSPGNAAKSFILRGSSASERRRTSVPAPATVSAPSYMGFSHRCDVLKAIV
jgi:hypothetical protein